MMQTNVKLPEQQAYITSNQLKDQNGSVEALIVHVYFYWQEYHYFYELNMNC